MTDLEITKLCAEAMEFHIEQESTRAIQVREHWPAYDPLHDDAQAMALVKRFRIQVDWSSYDYVWCNAGGREYTKAFPGELNRAICECVAKMQLAKRTESEPERK